MHTIHPNPTPEAAPVTSAPPSVHVRAVITWIAIFPLVALGMLAIAPFSGDWHPILRALILSVLIVPVAVYLVVPQLMRIYAKFRAGAL